MLRRAPLLLGLCSVALSLSCACNRTEEPAAPSSSAETPKTSDSAPAATASNTAASACTVPFQAAPVAPKAARCPADPTGNLTMPTGKITFVDAPGAPVVDVELAESDAARERGLMYRTSMPESHGMLFSWDEESIRTFWMHNTCLPLDMLYVSKDGVIAGILEQVPTLNDEPRSVGCPAAHVLELNAGWARAHGVAPGMKLKIEG